jgi:hypothetical protein
VNAPRSIALAAAQRLEAMIALNKSDPFMQQTMKSASLVVIQAGLLPSSDVDLMCDAPWAADTGGTYTLH